MSIQVVDWEASQNEKASSVMHLRRELSDLPYEGFQRKSILTDLAQGKMQRCARSAAPLAQLTLGENQSIQLYL